MGGWDKVDKIKEGGGLFVKLKGGETIQGVFVGEPYCFYNIFGDKTEHADYVPDSSFRFKINMAVKENGAFTMKIFGGGVTVAKLVRKLLQKVGPDNLFEIEREGNTKDDTTYYVTPMGIVNQADLAHIRALKLNPLTGKSKMPDNDDFPPPEAYEDGNY